MWFIWGLASAAVGAEMGVVCCDGALGTHSVILTEP